MDHSKVRGKNRFLRPRGRSSLFLAGDSPRQTWLAEFDSTLHLRHKCRSFFARNKNPDRIIFNIEVDDIKKEVARLKKAKVKQIQPTYHVEGYGWISTFADIDGNYFQLVQVRATPKKR